MQREPAASDGYSLLELLFVVGLMATIAGFTVPQILAALDDFRAYGAARYMTARLYQTRMDAVAHTANAAMRFIEADNSYLYSVFLDGNRNGVLSADIARGADREIQRAERLSERFPGVDFGAVPGLPSVDGSPPPGDDPVRFGATNMVAFTALGTSTPGSLYIRGRRDAQYVIRVFGQTGKIRILKFNPKARLWKPL